METTKQQLEAMFNARQSDLIDEIFLKIDAQQKRVAQLQGIIEQKDSLILLLRKTAEQPKE